MSKLLSEMTLEELWELFPIILSEPNEEWPVWYEEEKKNLQNLLPDTVKIYHIGSTAISGIWAKPIVDILVEIPVTLSLNDLKEILVQNDYICMSEQEGRISLNKGYTPEGFAERVFHIHLRRSGDNDEIIFKDYMNDNPHLAKKYEKLKLSLWKQYEHDRDGYTEAKTDFIKKYSEEAKKK